jgi:hypothetical protein
LDVGPGLGLIAHRPMQDPAESVDARPPVGNALRPPS